VLYSTYGGGSGNIWLDNVGCTGNENALEDCPHAGWGAGNGNCGHYEDVAITCGTVIGKQWHNGVSCDTFGTLFSVTYVLYNYARKVSRRRSVKRARRRSSSPQATATQLSSQHLQQSSRSQLQQRQQQQQQRQQQQLRPAHSAPIVYGKASGVSGTNIAAAKIMHKKAVFVWITLRNVFCE